MNEDEQMAYDLVDRAALIVELRDKLAAAEARISELEEENDLQRKTLKSCIEARNGFQDRIAELEAALRLIDEFAWTAVTADCEEARQELNRRVAACRKALSAK